MSSSVGIEIYIYLCIKAASEAARMLPTLLLITPNVEPGGNTCCVQFIDLFLVSVPSMDKESCNLPSWDLLSRLRCAWILVRCGILRSQYHPLQGQTMRKRGLKKERGWVSMSSLFSLTTSSWIAEARVVG
uniref:Uncharacterized protein n=1 Tax=Trypanosoma vivax (strain Y486) TaxID=1055687 RepID=G0TWS5_TRYVY|nr:hypothetical protein TVY486_0602040 [Trypanosoma vivax Y486]